MGFRARFPTDLVFSLSVVLCLLAPDASGGAWLDPGAPGVTTVLDSGDTSLAFYAGPTNPAEWLINRGSSSQVRVKSYDDPALLQFDLSALAGRTVLDAELHLARVNPNSPVFGLVAATINAPFAEGTSGTAVDGNPCWRWREYDAASPDDSLEWTFGGSDFSTASFGNFGSLVSFSSQAADSFRSYTSGGATWIAMKLDPALVHALILDQYGLTVTDGRGRAWLNPQIYTREAGASLQPRLLIRAVNDDVTPPFEPTGLSVRDGAWNGEAIVSFEAPLDPQDGLAFGYELRHSLTGDFATATPVAHWRIPRPLAAGLRQEVLLEDLTPGVVHHFFIRAYDKAGNASGVATALLQLQAALADPEFQDGGFPDPDPSGRTIAGVPGVLDYWVCSELAKVSPLTGSRLQDVGSGAALDDYKKANPVWDSATRKITLHPARNEVVGFQLILGRKPANLTGISATVSDLAGPRGVGRLSAENVTSFKLHYVTAGAERYPDPAIPLQPPFASRFDLPSVNNPGGLYQAIWFDLYVPAKLPPGTYSGTLSFACDQLLAPVKLPLEVQVQDVALPDEPSFLLDLNGYGNKWSSEASRFQVFQLCHAHRMVPNTLPYGWNGSVTSDRAPSLVGAGPTLAVGDWSQFDSLYGPFLDGSAFDPNHPTAPYHGPGRQTPIADFYTTFHEGWPLSLTDTQYGFDAAGAGWSHWNQRVDGGDTSAWLEMPDTFEAFPSGYATGYANVATQFAEHAQQRGWHGTAFQIYLNNKYSYSNCISLWTLEEQYVADDFRADAWFLGLCNQGALAAAAPDVRWHWRIDTSTRWGQNWGQLRGLCNLRAMGGDINWYYRQIRYRRVTEPQDESWWWYGTGPTAQDPLSAHPAEFLKQWSHGLDGGLPYWDNYHTDWDNADPLAILLSGSSVPGHGFFDGRIATIRMKGMRRGVQTAEYLNLLAGLPDWNRSKTTRALSGRYGDGAEHDSFGGDSFENMTILDHFRLRADLQQSIRIEGKKTVDFRR